MPDCAPWPYGVRVTDWEWRPLTPNDVPAYTGLVSAAEAVDKTGENYSEEDLAEELKDESVDLDSDSWAVFDADQLVAVGVVHGSQQVWDVDSLHCFGVVHPSYRRNGIGRQLLARQLDRAEQIHLDRHPRHPARISMRPYDHVTSAAALAKAAGLRPVRHWYDMERDLRTDAPGVRALAQPLRLVPFTADRDDEVRRAHNTAFREHYGSTERDPSIWKQWFTGSRNFRADLSFFAIDNSQDDAVAGYLLGYFYDADAAVDGYREAWIGQLGTLPAWRGRGVGTALLAHALASYRSAGYEQAGLDVDTGNVTGALGMYERVGFTVVRSSTSWVREIQAVPA